MSVEIEGTVVTEKETPLLGRIISWPLKLIHKLYGWVALTIIAATFLGGGVSLAAAFVGTVGYGLMGLVFAIALFVFFSVVGQGMSGLIRLFDPTYNKDVLAKIGKEIAKGMKKGEVPDNIVVLNPEDR